jgi:hypothetical protein
MRTDELIVSLARSARPVVPIDSPSIRLARWTLGTALVMTLAVIAIGPRTNVLIAAAQPVFLGLAIVTVCTALLSAASALTLAIPGAERSPWQRVLPLVAGSAWILALVYLLSVEGAAMARLLQWPVHVACLLEIAGLGVMPGWALFAMLRRAAPLQRAWSGALATLAAVALSAAATQFICPIDDPAHHLVGHVLPVIVLSMLGAIAGLRCLDSMANCVSVAITRLVFIVVGVLSVARRRAHSRLLLARREDTRAKCVAPDGR